MANSHWTTMKAPAVDGRFVMQGLHTCLTVCLVNWLAGRGGYAACCFEAAALAANSDNSIKLGLLLSGRSVSSLSSLKRLTTGLPGCRRCSGALHVNTGETAGSFRATNYDVPSPSRQKQQWKVAQRDKRKTGQGRLFKIGTKAWKVKWSCQ